VIDAQEEPRAMLALELVEDLDGSAPEFAANEFVVHGLLHVTQ